MTHPLVVNLKSEPYDVRIDRRTKWGNPFRVGPDGSRADVIRKHMEWLFCQPELMESFDELRGKRLGCWCSPRPCHGDTLARLANSDKQER